MRQIKIKKKEREQLIKMLRNLIERGNFKLFQVETWVDKDDKARIFRLSDLLYKDRYKIEARRI